MAPQASLEEALGLTDRIPLFVFRCNETGKLVWFAPLFKHVPTMLFSLSAQPFMFFCYYVPVSSAAFRQGQFVRCVSCATRLLHTWINTAQSRLEVPFSCVGKCFGCFTGEQHHVDYIPDKISSPYFAACHTIVRFRKIPAQCFL